ncbi:zinc finger protein-domain-containing protein [Emericellopsis atlantica]|uniref:Zinc finger protein-domain-containing protein n=1 Tax=Emericellopsis atlantica TaxID=2614577 RepID=A0A9P7ZI38_9HYPO|nr:zinc finger protein-domain-containing protein [Emericellopsis atlantica]KAG9252202.1 zinc finger protein-domain-containing protein [Emericellopsis atlantica]
MDRPASLGEDIDTDRGYDSRKPLVEIGKGQCGTVFALPGSIPSGFAAVAKIPNAEEKFEQLLNDCCDPALAKDINIPRVATCYHGRLHTHEFALVSARVFAVPMSFRHAIVDSLCPPAIRETKQEFLAMPVNQNCLVRIYLGRRESNKNQTKLGNFKLQNFPLHAGVDGNDVEFILGRSPDEVAAAEREASLDENEHALAQPHQSPADTRGVSVWLIDFNLCSTFEDNSAGLKKIVDAFFWNDPYYPDPSSDVDGDKKLWAAFKERYLEVSRQITNSATPERFIAEIEAKCRKASVGGLF